MNKDYVPAPVALKKLKEARSTHKTVFIFGATGYGKTRLVKEYLDFHKYIYVDCEGANWNLNDIPEAPLRQIAYVVVDNIQFVDKDREHELEQLMERDDIWLVLISRSRVVDCILQLFVEDRLFVIGEEDLKLGPKEVLAIAQSRGVKLTREESEIIASHCDGNAFVITHAIQSITHEKLNVGPELFAFVDRVFMNYFEKRALKHWPPELVEFLATISIVDSFTVDFAEMLTGDMNVRELIEASRRAGNFLQQRSGEWVIRPALRVNLIDILHRQKSPEYIRNLYHSAGRYYERMGHFEAALKLYETGGLNDDITELLIRNVRRSSVPSSIWEYRHYYNKLSEKEISKSPVLLCAMSILNSISMREEESEKYYSQLCQYADEHEGGEWQVATSLVTYLDIILPHRHSVAIEDIIANAAKRIKDDEIHLPPVPITSAQGSVIRGGRDLYRWVQAGDDVGNIIDFDKLGTVCNVSRSALEHLIRGEIAFERGESLEKVISNAGAAQLELEIGHKMGLLFAAIVVQMKLALHLGEYGKAVELIESFESRLSGEALLRLKNIVNARKLKLALLAGNLDAVAELMNQLPSEDEEFCSLYRDIYLARVHGYFALGKNLEAAMLITKLGILAERHDRKSLMVNIQVLAAIYRYRTGNEELCLQYIHHALQSGQEYGMVRLFSEYGAVLRPILKGFEKRGLPPDIDKKYFAKVLANVTEIAEYYPNYLNASGVNVNNFSESALAILRLQAAGKKTREIAAELHLSESTIKYHCSETYRKLGVKGKTDAVRKAAAMRLI